MNTADKVEHCSTLSAVFSNEAINANCLRGNFESSDMGNDGKREFTAYSGTHSVQCFIIKCGICVAKSKEFIINIK